MTDQAEQLKTEIMAMTERLADEALSGEIRGCIVLKMRTDGQLESGFIGITPVEALGAAQVFGNLMLRKIIS